MRRVHQQRRHRHHRKPSPFTEEGARRPRPRTTTPAERWPDQPATRRMLDVSAQRRPSADRAARARESAPGAPAGRSCRRRRSATPPGRCARARCGPSPRGRRPRGERWQFAQLVTISRRRRSTRSASAPAYSEQRDEGDGSRNSPYRPSMSAEWVELPEQPVLCHLLHPEPVFDTTMPSQSRRKSRCWRAPKRGPSGAGGAGSVAAGAGGSGGAAALASASGGAAAGAADSSGVGEVAVASWGAAETAGGLARAGTGTALTLRKLPDRAPSGQRARCFGGPNPPGPPSLRRKGGAG